MLSHKAPHVVGPRFQWGWAFPSGDETRTRWRWWLCSSVIILPLNCSLLSVTLRHREFLSKKRSLCNNISFKNISIVTQYHNPRNFLLCIKDCFSKKGSIGFTIYQTAPWCRKVGVPWTGSSPRPTLRTCFYLDRCGPASWSLPGSPWPCLGKPKRARVRTDAWNTRAQKPLPPRPPPPPRR